MPTCKMRCTVIRAAYSLRGFFDAWYLPAHQLAVLSVYSYRAAIGSFDGWHKMPVALDELCDELACEWLLALDQAKTPKATSKSYRGNVLTVWRFAWEKKLIADLPRFVRPIRLPKRVPEAWTLAELERILKSAALMPGYVGPWPARDWWPALLLTIYDLGGRITATMHLESRRCDLENRWALLRAEHGKTDEDEPFTLSQQATDALRRIWGPREHVFGDWPYDWTQHDWKALTKAYRKILTHAGLPTGPRDLFHKLRRTTGTQVRIVAGRDVAAACLRHKDPDTFSRSYDDVRQGGVVSAADYLPRPQLNCSKQLELF